MHLSCVGMFIGHFIADILMSMKQFWKLVNILWSCNKKLGLSKKI